MSVLRIFRGLAFAMLVAACLFVQATPLYARSASSPRHTGLEPPGGPRPLDVLPGAGPSRTPQGGMGYTDAYGNTIDDQPAQEVKPRKRLRSGAYGGQRQKEPIAGLPDPKNIGAPLWSFH